MGKRGPKRSITGEATKVVIDLYQKGVSTEEIALQLGVSPNTVRRTTREAGVSKVNGMSPLSDDRRLGIIEACRRGEGGENVARRFGISRSTVGKILREARVSLPFGPSRKLDDDQTARIIMAFEEGATEQQVADRFGIGRTTVQRTIARAGIAKSADRAMPRATPGQKESAFSACVDEGLSKKQAAEDSKISESTVYRLLRQRGVKLPTGRPASCEVDHMSFSVITRASAYWMGFLFTDGCLTEDEYGAPALKINLQEGDRGHLEKLRAFLKSTHKIGWRDKLDSVLKDGSVIHGGPAATFKVRSEQIVADLIAHGMDWKKEDRDEISPALVASPDFWRGCVDGDGWLACNLGKYPGLNLSGNLPLCKHFQKFLRDEALADLQIGPTESGIFRLGTGGSKGYAMLKQLYGHGGIYLDRKYLHAQELMRDYEQRHNLL